MKLTDLLILGAGAYLLLRGIPSSSASSPGLPDTNSASALIPTAQIQEAKALTEQATMSYAQAREAYRMADIAYGDMGSQLRSLLSSHYGYMETPGASVADSPYWTSYQALLPQAQQLKEQKDYLYGLQRELYIATR